MAALAAGLVCGSASRAMTRWPRRPQAHAGVAIWGIASRAATKAAQGFRVPRSEDMAGPQIGGPDRSADGLGSARSVRVGPGDSRAAGPPAGIRLRLTVSIQVGPAVDDLDVDESCL